MVNTSVPTLLRQQVDRWAQTWLTAKLSRLLELRARDPGPFNYPIEVFSEWRGKAFYLNVRYRVRGVNYYCERQISLSPRIALAAARLKMISSFVTRG
jgi:hypothetical protein